MRANWHGCCGMRATEAAMALALVLAGGMARADCAAVPAPVQTLDFASRYVAGDASASQIDPDTATEAQDALRPVDDFLRDLTQTANAALAGQDAAQADCAVRAMALWAQADALADLGSETARLTVGARLAGFALVLGQTAPLTTDADARAQVQDWLTRRVTEQTLFWEDDAPAGARQGNLRAWAALAGAALTAQTGDPALRHWAAWSVTRVLCTAAPDGSLPQEMRRGRLALQYQLHAVSPLVVAALLLERQGQAVTAVCGGALDRAVGFALADLDTGAATAAITGQVQSFFDGSDTLENFHLAWLEAYLRLETAAHRAPAEALAAPRRPLRYSKLGGDQTRLWSAAP
jgi:poly(beta-D-mannuronate) lyase